MNSKEAGGVNNLKNYISSNPKNVKIFIIAAAVIFVLTSSLIIGRGEKQKGQLTNEPPALAQIYRNEQYKFEIKYPYKIKEDKNQIVFSGESRFSKILYLNIYDGRTINTVIDEIKARYPGTNLEEKDIRINACTSRKNVIEFKDKIYTFYFLTTGPSTYALEIPADLGTVDQRLAEEIVNSLNCF